jgi:benzodiazapine receptor
MNVKLKNFLFFLLSLGVVSLIAYLGTILVIPNINSWYATINKPSFNPPSYLFSPVWTILFILMAIAFFLVLRDCFSKGQDKRYFRAAVLSFGAQLLLNLYWSFLFFFTHEPGLAFFGLISLWLMIIVNIYYFSKINKAAAYLLSPYLLWVAYAGVLNYAIWVLNV